MMRNKTSSSMQKTYDDCYLMCSTAVYFEGQNNESEALRQWRSALDRIYYHNAYRVPPDYRPKSETEKALQESLRALELQCKERVDLLEALRDSRAETRMVGEQENLSGDTISNTENNALPGEQPGWIGQGSIPTMNYPDLARPALPPRPPIPRSNSSRVEALRPEGVSHTSSSSHSKPLSPLPSPQLPQTSRTPSPEKRPRMRTTLRSSKDSKKPTKAKITPGQKPQAASRAAANAWESISRSSGVGLGRNIQNLNNSSASIPTANRDSFGDGSDSRRASEDSTQRISYARPPTPPTHIPTPASSYLSTSNTDPLASLKKDHNSVGSSSQTRNSEDLPTSSFGVPDGRGEEGRSSLASAKSAPPRPPRYDSNSNLSYRNEYPVPAPLPKASITAAVVRPRFHEAPKTTLPIRRRSPQRKPQPPPVPVHRRPVGSKISPRENRSLKPANDTTTSSESTDDTPDAKTPVRKSCRKDPHSPEADAATPPSSGRDSPEGDPDSAIWEERVKYVKKNLPRGVDPYAAKQIFNEIVVSGDEVRWDDVAGLDAAKKALKEAVVYPFLRPDLFMGLREPARGMLLFGPPGTGKTMLARAVATESRSTFFAISASSLTSKWLGDSEKLVRALFGLAKALAPSIIFVDEIDSLLSSRGGSSEHESTRRIKTEFLIQWSDLQRAAAGKEQSAKEKKIGDASRVLVLAATNLPWAIDEAARRRFVRRQYIPLPEDHVRGQQLRTLLGHQKHDLNENDIQVLVELTDGYSGSDITALAKDAAMGPLRSLGEALLHMSKDEIRPIQFGDFEASLINIRPSVNKQGLKEFEDWAKEFGERGG